MTNSGVTIAGSLAVIAATLAAVAPDVSQRVKQGAVNGEVITEELSSFFGKLLISFRNREPIFAMIRRPLFTGEHIPAQDIVVDVKTN